MKLSYHISLASLLDNMATDTSVLELYIPWSTTLHLRQWLTRPMYLFDRCGIFSRTGIQNVPFLDRNTRHSIVRSYTTSDRYLINPAASMFFGQGLRRRRTAVARLATCSRSRQQGNFGPQSGVIPPASAPEPAVPPTRAQLRTLFYHSAVPMIGFGGLYVPRELIRRGL